jgi:hypothetical protein
VRLTVKPVGKPDAGNPHVRFDERGWETGLRYRAHPRLYTELLERLTSCQSDQSVREFECLSFRKLHWITSTRHRFDMNTPVLPNGYLAI